MKEKSYSIGFMDAIGYYGTVLFSLGTAWLIKTIIVKAIVDALNSSENLVVTKQ